MKSEPSFLNPRLAGFLKTGLNFLLPPRCFSCGIFIDQQGGLCGECWGKLSFISSPFCEVCGYPFPHDMPGGICGACVQKPPVYEKARSALAYDEGSRALILSFKHGDRMEGLTAMGQWLTRAAEDFLNIADMILPVPLHPRRLLQRRYNQSALLSTVFAKQAGLPHDPLVLVRTRNTPTQGGLTPIGRKRNVQAAFAIEKGKEGQVSGKNIILIDDVLTTGATADQCARTLKKSGAKNVFVLTLSRVVSPLHKSS